MSVFFGDNHVTPTHDEYGMYMAKSASLRSSDLSRQVGAAIFLDSGEIATLGCNEVPKAGGGTYWMGDLPDGRDFVQGHDPNERHKVALLVDIVDRLKKSSALAERFQEIESPYSIAKALLQETGAESIRESRIMDLIEFGRIIHAEMSAVCDAARRGIPLKNATLYCTTFPCHICAKHIIASGIKRVVYIEPYPKSYATELHEDAIEIENEFSDKVAFLPFRGISPFRYRDLFEKGKRKYSGGEAQRWHRGEKGPMIDVEFPSYFEAETLVVATYKSSLPEEANS